jgi:hypothetical protein
MTKNIKEVSRCVMTKGKLKKKVSQCVMGFHNFPRPAAAAATHHVCDDHRHITIIIILNFESIHNFHIAAKLEFK